LIEAIFFCASCAMRYRSREPSASRSCICGADLLFDARSTLRVAILQSDAPLEQLIETVLRLKMHLGEPDRQAERPSRF
jgi:hypothetical protein